MILLKIDNKTIELEKYAISKDGYGNEVIYAFSSKLNKAIKPNEGKDFDYIITNTFKSIK